MKLTLLATAIKPLFWVYLYSLLMSIKKPLKNPIEQMRLYKEIHMD
ncbi:hypothetical protein P20439_1676 [Pseudoalteromonas sp. BSi20439]|nr:hypothetical protein P20439_1676 [Pseudoalteromonas sp. BSi20439]